MARLARGQARTTPIALRRAFVAELVAYPGMLDSKRVIRI